MNSNEIRKAFLSFFEEHGHERVPSSSLLPVNDPTLLFTNAGMVQFKDAFTGQAQRKMKRATSSQKCVRAGGKHNDLENVGFTPRHHTFFEMLGNFSFGDYFKGEAIEYAWAFLTKVMKLDADRLSITVFRDDDEAEKLWQERVGVSLDKISRCDEKDNFWAMGDTGPCGPCSEIHYDQGPSFKNHDDRYLEVWNLVFMQFNRDEKGKLHPLPKPSIDTGMGLERLTAIHQKVKSNYEIDSIKSIIDYTAKMAGITYGNHKEGDVSLRVIADHARATGFLIADGVIPGNEGASYVLRRIMRRGIRHGKKLGLDQTFLNQVVDQVIRQMHEVYPELGTKKKFIVDTTKREEERFAETLDHGLAILDEEMSRIKGSKSKTLSGEVIFQLYDTYGFPVDLTQTIAAEKGLKLDMKGFETEMQKQVSRSQKAGKALGKKASEKAELTLISKSKDRLNPTTFKGYDHAALDTKILKIMNEKAFIDEAQKGARVSIITEETPFYAESGGQEADRGFITSTQGLRFQVLDTQKVGSGIYIHRGEVIEGEVHTKDKVHMCIDEERRAQLQLNHSATHLVHAALREILGKHVHQKGSLVAKDRLRFDFTHFEALDDQTLRTLEDLVNHHTRANHDVETKVMPYKKAMKTGAMALFGEKYGDEVRVVQMSPFSVELCGGTHVRNTGEIGLVRFRTETGVASGVRRIEALTGQSALDFSRESQDALAEMAHKIKAGHSGKEIHKKLDKLLEERKRLQEENRNLKTGSSGNGQSFKPKSIHNVSVIEDIKNDLHPKDLRVLADKAMNQLKSGIVALASKRDGKVSLIVVVSKDLTKKFHAGKIVKAMAEFVEGSGGGRPDMAQAGGNNPEGLKSAFEALPKILKGA